MKQLFLRHGACILVAALPIMDLSGAWPGENQVFTDMDPAPIAV